MENKDLLVDVPSIRDYNTKMVLKNNEIIEIIDDMIEDFKDIDKKFNSTAGAKFKEKLLNYLQESRDNINNSNQELTNKITTIANIYEDTYNNVKNTVA